MLTWFHIDMPNFQILSSIFTPDNFTQCWKGFGVGGVLFWGDLSIIDIFWKEVLVPICCFIINF